MSSKAEGAIPVVSLSPEQTTEQASVHVEATNGNPFAKAEHAMEQLIKEYPFVEVIKLENIRNVDPTTGLQYVFPGFFDDIKPELNRLIENDKKEYTQLVLLSVNISGFKGVNDKLGHTGANGVLKDVAQNRVEAVVTSILGMNKGAGKHFTGAIFKMRPGGDQVYAALVLQATDTEQLQRQTAKVQEQLLNGLKPYRYQAKEGQSLAVQLNAQVASGEYQPDGNLAQQITHLQDLLHTETEKKKIEEQEQKLARTRDKLKAIMSRVGKNLSQEQVNQLYIDAAAAIVSEWGPVRSTKKILSTVFDDISSIVLELQQWGYKLPITSKLSDQVRQRVRETRAAQSIELEQQVETVSRTENIGEKLKAGGAENLTSVERSSLTNIDDLSQWAIRTQGYREKEVEKISEKLQPGTTLLHATADARDIFNMNLIMGFDNADLALSEWAIVVQHKIAVLVQKYIDSGQYTQEDFLVLFSKPQARGDEFDIHLLVPTELLEEIKKALRNILTTAVPFFYSADGNSNKDHRYDVRAEGGIAAHAFETLTESSQNKMHQTRDALSQLSNMQEEAEEELERRKQGLLFSQTISTVFELGNAANKSIDDLVHAIAEEWGTRRPKDEHLLFLIEQFVDSVQSRTLENSEAVRFLRTITCGFTGANKKT